MLTDYKINLVDTLFFRIHTYPYAVEPLLKELFNLYTQDWQYWYFGIRLLQNINIHIYWSSCCVYAKTAYTGV